MEEREVVIIGGGPAGYTAAIRVMQLGGKATIIEKDIIGGVCLNHGCIPTGVLARAIELLEMGRFAKDYGIIYKEMEIDFRKMMNKKDTVVRTLVSGVRQMLDVYGVEVINGKGRFLSPSVVEVEIKDGTKRELKPRKTILATGSKYSPIPFSDGLGRIISPLEALKLKEIPKSMVVVGGGFIGIVFVTIFSKLGTKVTLLEESQRILPQVDREIVLILEKELRDYPIQLYPKAKIKKIRSNTEESLKILSEVEGEEIEIEAQYLLITETREASIEDLGLKEAGIELNSKGGISVNERMETSIPGIYAIGDVTMEHMWTTVAYFEGLIAAENSIGKNSKMDYKAIPLCTYSIPEVSCVGMTEEEALSKGYKLKIGRFPFTGNGMAAILGQRTGIVKIIQDERYGEILGVHIIGPRAGDLIAEATLAMKMEGTPKDIAKTFHLHPTLSEALWEATRGL